MEIGKYARKPFVLEAVRITPANMAEVSAWCDGEIRAATEKDLPPGKSAGQLYIYVRVFRPKYERQCWGFAGDWVLKSGTGYKVYGNTAFLNDFAPAEQLLGSAES